jgi:hypothetical protein
MQKLQISIPEPCHENWHTMTPTQQGRFCNACAKEVVDFSMMNRYRNLSIRKLRFIGYQILTAIVCLISTGGFSQNGNDIEKTVLEEMLTGNSMQPKKTHIVIRLACPRSLDTNPPNLLYVLDGNIVEPGIINTDSVETVTLLKDSVVVLVIFGITGKNGAMIITSKKLKDLDTPVVSTAMCTKRAEVMGSITKGIQIRATVADPLKMVAAKNTGPVKIYPNPVLRGNSFSISLQLKQAGNYNIQITDVTGRIVLQKQTNILTKEYIEQLQTDSRWGSGVYYIRVFDNNNKPINKASFIVQ